jgi:hypothetical protein
MILESPFELLPIKVDSIIQKTQDTVGFNYKPENQIKINRINKFIDQGNIKMFDPINACIDVSDRKIFFDKASKAIEKLHQSSHNPKKSLAIFSASFSIFNPP